MKILLIDTCGATGSIALANTVRSPALVACASLPGRSAAERLVPAIRALATDSAINLNQLDAVAVVHGPGSFTGVRVGLSAAKGLCHALNLPLVAISRLTVLASLAAHPLAGVPPSSQGVPHSSQFVGDEWVVRALLDAGRGEFYSGLYADGTCLRETLLTRDQLLAEVSFAEANLAEQRSEEAQLIVCEPAVAQSLGAPSKLRLGGNATPQLVAEPSAADALPLALARIQQRAFDDPASIDANYLRRTDVEIFAKPAAAAVPQPRPSHPGPLSR
jgi:tRNA threonylcarbamoyladenosine biosynthesis protein TsaB